MAADLPDDVKEKLAKLDHYEKRFADLVKSFKKLASQKKAADNILKETTPLRSIADAEALEAHLKNLNLKNEMSIEEIKRLTNERLAMEKQLKEQSTVAAPEDSSVDATKELEEANGTIQGLRATVDELQGQLASKVEHESSTGQRISDLEQLLEDTRSRLSTANDEITAAHEQYQLRLSDLQQDNRRLTELVQKSESETQQAKKLTQEVENLQTQLTQVREASQVTDDHNQTQAKSTAQEISSLGDEIGQIVSHLKSLVVDNEVVVPDSSAIQELPNRVASPSRDTAHSLSPPPGCLVVDRDSLITELGQLGENLSTISHTLQYSVHPPGRQIPSPQVPTTSTLSSSESSKELQQVEVLVKERNELQTTLESVRVELSDASGRISRLDQENQRLTREAEEHKKSAESLQVQLTTTLKEITTYQQDQKSYEERITALETETQDVKMRLQTRESQLEKKQGECDELSNRAHTLQTKVEDLQRQLQELQEKHDSLENRFVQQKQQLNASREHLETSDEKVVDLTDQLERARRQLKQSTLDLQKAQDAQQDVSSQLEQLKTHHEELQNSTKQQLEEAERKAQEATRAIQENEGRRVELVDAKKQVDHLQADLTTSRQLFEDKTQLLDQKQAQLHETETELKQLKATHDLQTSEAQRVQQVLRDELANQRRQAVQSLERVRKELTQRTEELTQIQQEVQPKLAVLEEVEAERDTLCSQLTTLRSTVETLEKAAVEQTLELETLQSKESQWETTKKSQEQTMEELGLREAHWRKINRDLKDEVRRLRRELRTNAGPTSRTPTPLGLHPTENPNRALSPTQSAVSPRSTQTLSPNGNYSRWSTMGQKLGSTREMADNRSATSSGVSSPIQDAAADTNTLSPAGLAPHRAKSPSGGDPMSRLTGPPDTNGRPLTPAAAMETTSQSLGSPTLPGAVNQGVAVNLEYMRNVVLKFLESRDHRPQLIPVLATLLKFTPEETKRLQRH